MTDEPETYAFETRCENCKKNVELTVPVGTRVSDYVATASCPHCGCELK